MVLTHCLSFVVYHYPPSYPRYKMMTLPFCIVGIVLQGAESTDYIGSKWLRHIHGQVYILVVCQGLACERRSRVTGGKVCRY